MDIKNKILRLDSQFTKELPSKDDEIDSIYISGYASTNDVDRVGDVIPTGVWEKGIQNYLKNPILLAYHDHDDPCGRMVEHKIDDKGLWIKGRISAAAEIFSLVKDEVVTAFSVGFRVHDAEYNAATELFVIKELELLEISVVAVPCNQNTTFSLAKSFDSEDEYKAFKSSFVPNSESAKGLEEANKGSKDLTLKEIGMDPKELEKLLADTAEKAAAATAKAIKDAQEKAAEEAAKKAAEEAELQKRIAEAVAKVTPTQTGGEKLLEEVTKRFEEQAETTKKTIDDLRTQLVEKQEELLTIQKSKMTFTDGKKDEVSYEDKEKAVLLAAILRKGMDQTKFGRQLVEKAGAHVANATWELEVSLNMENEVRRRLVVAPILRSVQMQTNVMKMPLNPEAGYGTWVTNAQFGTTDSPGAAQTHQLSEITLNAYKLATREYLANEEEEDALLPILPVVRDAMIRRVAKSVDLAFLRGAGSGADPVKGLAIYDATSAVQATNTGAASVANLRALRKDLGAWGLDTNDVTYIVSTDVYYDLLDDTLFQTVDKVGTRATLLTGQIGTIGNSPVLVSAEFPTKAGGSSSASTNIAAIAVATANFMVGNQRGMKFESQDLVETQRRVFVASLRTGLVQLTTNLGQGVSTFRWS